MHNPAETVVSLLIGVVAAVMAVIVFRRNVGGNCAGWKLRFYGIVAIAIAMVLQASGQAFAQSSLQILAFVVFVCGAAIEYVGLRKRLKGDTETK